MRVLFVVDGDVREPAARIRAYQIIPGLRDAGVECGVLSTPERAGPLGIVGAGVATLLSSAFMLFVTIIRSQPHFRIPYEWRRLLATSALIVTAVFGARTLLDEKATSVLGLQSLSPRFALSALVSIAIGALLLHREERAAAGRWLRRLSPFPMRVRELDA